MGLPIVRRDSAIPRVLSVFISIGAITIWPFVFIRRGVEPSVRLIRHETIHIRQYNELLVVGFWLVYLFDWLRGLIKYRDTDKAYRQIRMEQEAYENEYDETYLERRRHFAWWHYRV